jgi:uncharacterized membrane protein YhiD involved in acid resistance
LIVVILTIEEIDMTDHKKKMTDLKNQLERLILLVHKKPSKNEKYFVSIMGAFVTPVSVIYLISIYGVTPTGAVIASLNGTFKTTAVIHWLSSLIGLSAETSLVMIGFLGLLGSFVLVIGVVGLLSVFIGFTLLKVRTQKFDDLPYDEQQIVTEVSSLTHLINIETLNESGLHDNNIQSINNRVIKLTGKINKHYFDNYGLDKTDKNIKNQRLVALRKLLREIDKNILIEVLTFAARKEWLFEPDLNEKKQNTTLLKNSSKPQKTNLGKKESNALLSARMDNIVEKTTELSKTLGKKFKGKRYEKELNELKNSSDLILDSISSLNRKMYGKKWLNDLENNLVGIISNILKSEEEGSKVVDVVIAKAAGATVYVGITGLVSAYGVASTGTAIATLSGAAEATAVMYWLGSIVGLGAVAGTVITGGLSLIGGYFALKMLKNRPRSLEDLSEEEIIIVNACLSLIKSVKEAQESNELITKESADFLEKKVLVPLREKLLFYQFKEAEKVLGLSYKEKLDSRIYDFNELLDKLRSW